jgi:hypothetical protein
MNQTIAATALFVTGTDDALSGVQLRLSDQRHVLGELVATLRSVGVQIVQIQVRPRPRHTDHLIRIAERDGSSVLGRRRLLVQAAVMTLLDRALAAPERDSGVRNTLEDLERSA